MSTAEQLYLKLIAKNNYLEMPIYTSIELLAQLIDLASDLGKVEGVKIAIDYLNQILNSEVELIDAKYIYYLIGTAYSNLQKIDMAAGGNHFEWNNEYAEKEIINLRLAYHETDHLDIPIERKCQIYSNLGAAMNRIGRYVEGNYYLDKALKINANFGMAYAIKGYNLYMYAKTLYDKEQISLLMKFAYNLLQKSILMGIHERAEKQIRSSIDFIDSKYSRKFLNSGIHFNSNTLGEIDNEHAYRSWCLKSRLFLNPLNELGEYGGAARDTLNCPPVVIKDRSFHFHGMYNQIKQEYVSARLLFYEGISCRKVHYSDKGVILYNTLDYPSYSLNMEKQKLAFRSLYSIFDKIAYFINWYFNLDIPEYKIEFKSIWFDYRRKNEKKLKRQFINLENWPLRGLYWISKDLYDENEEFCLALEPDAKNLREIRNNLEHKHLKIHSELIGHEGRAKNNESLTFTDKLAYSIFRIDFSKKTIKLLSMVRAAIMYLALAIHREEYQRKTTSDPQEFIGNFYLDIWDDNWKS